MPYKGDTMKLRLTLLLSLLITSCTGTRPSDIGIIDGKLKPCPDKPNCVSSFETKEQNRIQPLKAGKEPLKAIKSVLNSLNRVEIVKETPNYIHAEFTSLIMGYVDDGEFYVSGGSEVHVRSASRLGTSDFGVNRERIELIRAKLKGNN